MVSITQEIGDCCNHPECARAARREGHLIITRCVYKPKHVIEPLVLHKHTPPMFHRHGR